MGTKCCVEYYHDPKKAGRALSDTINDAPPPPLAQALLCSNLSTDKGRSYVNQYIPHTLQEDPTEAGVAVIDRRLGAEEDECLGRLEEKRIFEI